MKNKVIFLAMIILKFKWHGQHSTVWLQISI